MPGLPMSGYTRRKLLAATGFVIVSFFVLEIAVRLISHYDADGNRWFGDLRLKPYRLPVQRTTELLGKLTDTRSPKLIYDPDIGWVPSPALYGSNDQGFISTSAIVDRAPASDRLRIALFGASYTAGAWWRSLEKSLNDSGVPAEVLNFGCGGYGVDQAFLRWRKKGSAYKANIVIFGFSRKNCESDLNIFRLFAEPDSGIPFMKPRFLLAHDQLQLINTPTPAPGELPGIVARFGDWPLAGCEHFFVPADFQAFPWRHSALLALFEANLANTRGSNTGSIPAGGEEAQLALKIVRQFKSEVEAAGGSFYIVHLPLEADLQAFQDTGAFPFAGLLAEVKRTAIVFQPESAMLAVAQGHDLSRFFSDGHYTSEFNLAAGQSVAKALLACPEVVRFRKDHGGTSR